MATFGTCEELAQLVRDSRSDTPGYGEFASSSHRQAIGLLGEFIVGESNRSEIDVEDMTANTITNHRQLMSEIGYAETCIEKYDERDDICIILSKPVIRHPNIAVRLAQFFWMPKGNKDIWNVILDGGINTAIKEYADVSSTHLIITDRSTEKLVELISLDPRMDNSEEDGKTIAAMSSLYRARQEILSEHERVTAIGLNYYFNNILKDIISGETVGKRKTIPPLHRRQKR